MSSKKYTIKPLKKCQKELDTQRILYDNTMPIRSPRYNFNPNDFKTLDTTGLNKESPQNWTWLSTSEIETYQTLNLIPNTKNQRHRHWRLIIAGYNNKEKEKTPWLKLVIYDVERQQFALLNCFKTKYWCDYTDQYSELEKKNKFKPCVNPEWSYQNCGMTAPDVFWLELKSRCLQLNLGYRQAIPSPIIIPEKTDVIKHNCFINIFSGEPQL